MNTKVSFNRLVDDVINAGKLIKQGRHIDLSRDKCKPIYELNVLMIKSRQKQNSIL